MPETEAQRRAREMRSADRAAGTMFNLFPQGTFQSLGQAFQRSFSNPQSGTMMAGSAGVNPMMAGNIPQFPRLGPLVRTDYGLPPSERPEWRNPADQWDARPVTPAPNSIQSWAATPFRGNAATQAARRYEGLPPHLQSVVDRENMSAQSLGVVDASRSPLSGINAMPDTSIQGMSVDRTPIATRMAQMPSGLAGSSPFNLAGATQQTAPMLTNQAPEIPVNIAQAKIPIQTPYGTVYATAQQAGTGRVAEMGGLPAQSARLANIGERARGMGMARRGGQQIAENYRTTMTNFANRNISSPVDLPAPQGRFGQALVSNFPRSREAMARAEQTVSPTSPLASMGNAPSFPFMEERNRNPFSSIYGFQS